MVCLSRRAERRWSSAAVDDHLTEAARSRLPRGDRLSRKGTGAFDDRLSPKRPCLSRAPLLGRHCPRLAAAQSRKPVESGGFTLAPGLHLPEADGAGHL